MKNRAASIEFWEHSFPETVRDGLEILRQSDTCCEQERWADAFAALNAAATCHPAEPRFHALRAGKMCELGYCQDALDTLEGVLRCEPELDLARFWKGTALLMLQRDAEALAVLDGLVAETPSFPDAAWLRAAALRRTRNETDPEVLAAYALVGELDAANLYARVEHGDLLRGCGRYDEARALFASLFTPEACPDEALRLEATFKLGCVTMVLQDNETAMSAFRAVLDIAPDFPDAREMLELLAG